MSFSLSRVSATREIAVQLREVGAHAEPHCFERGTCDVSAIAEKLERGGDEIWSDEFARQHNVPLERPSHDAWGETLPAHAIPLLLKGTARARRRRGPFSRSQGSASWRLCSATTFCTAFVLAAPTDGSVFWHLVVEDSSHDSRKPLVTRFRTH